MGMKISDLARLPQRTRSDSCAASKPKTVDIAGTTSNHIMLLRMASQNLGSANI